MIPFDVITEWRGAAPWVQDSQVEQDLILSRALVEIFDLPGARAALAFRGGTALYTLHLTPPARSAGCSTPCARGSTPGSAPRGAP